VNGFGGSIQTVVGFIELKEIIAGCKRVDEYKNHESLQAAAMSAEDEAKISLFRYRYYDQEAKVVIWDTQALQNRVIYEIMFGVGYRADDCYKLKENNIELTTMKIDGRKKLCVMFNLFLLF